MAALVWVMMGIAIWHFTIFVPDRFWGGIVGAFLGAVAGAMLLGLIINGFTVPGQNDTDLGSALEADPGRADRHRRRVLLRRVAGQRAARRRSRRRRCDGAPGLRHGTAQFPLQERDSVLGAA